MIKITKKQQTIFYWEAVDTDNNSVLFQSCFDKDEAEERGGALIKLYKLFEAAGSKPQWEDNKVGDVMILLKP